MGGDNCCLGSLRRRLHKGVPLETGDAASKGLKVEPAGNPRGGETLGGGEFCMDTVHVAFGRSHVTSDDPKSEAQTHVLVLESTARCAGVHRHCAAAKDQNQ